MAFYGAGRGSGSRHWRRLALACGLGLLLAVPSGTAAIDAAGPAAAQQEPEPVASGWDVTAEAYRGLEGAAIVVVCPSHATAGSVWGTDVYTDDSSICTAAVHAGRITVAGGGYVIVQIRAGEQSYTGSTRNGVTTSSRGSWAGSFTVIDVVPPSPGIGIGGWGWNLTAVPFRRFAGESFFYICPPAGTLGEVRGTDVYTDDSSVCTAAAHAGLVSVESGGGVVIEIKPGQSSYQGSTRNGITSLDSGAAPGSFVMFGSGAGGGGGGAGAPPVGTATGRVLVNGQPFTSGPVPYGSKVDVTAGTLTMRVDVGTLAVYGDGKSPARFVPKRVSERVSGRTVPLVELKLVGSSFAGCGARALASRSQPAKPRVVRSLWGKGKGRFRTSGRYSAATVRGTSWLTIDRCDGTLTKVARGIVEVKDFTRGRTVRVRAGASYLAPAHR